VEKREKTGDVTAFRGVILVVLTSHSSVASPSDPSEKTCRAPSPYYNVLRNIGESAVKKAGHPSKPYYITGDYTK
jgi:hypothetical protein